MYILSVYQSTELRKRENEKKKYKDMWAMVFLVSFFLSYIFFELYRIHSIFKSKHFVYILYCGRCVHSN